MPRFSMTMEIDPRGVVISVCHGSFDASAWLRQRRSVFEERHELVAYDGHPVVTDLRDCDLPKSDWAFQFKAVAESMKHRRLKPFRRALIIGEEAGGELAVALFAEYQKIFHHPDVETRAFRDFDEGYAWAAEALPAHAAAESEVTESEVARALRQGGA